MFFLFFSPQYNMYFVWMSCGQLWKQGTYLKVFCDFFLTETAKKLPGWQNPAKNTRFRQKSENSVVLN